MKEAVKMNVFGFEGAHRAGKGTQIENVKKYFKNFDIPVFVLRGAGSRENGGKEITDPISDWWTKKNTGIAFC